ncbi:MAG: Gfo/Idh/MocA family oxidoreductase [Sphingomonadales bacterium]|nr:Gfo/Idh/MocA family oxidoreductase [Sphingomonadales bacterium]
MAQAGLRALVVGTGFGCRIQVPALRGAGFEVAGLVGANPQRTAERAAANGVPHGFTDMAEAIAATGADLVAISTPPHTHAPLTIAALEAGCHVLCEKPFARDVAEARAMLAAAEKAGKVHAIGNEFRFVPERAAMARAIAEGLIGAPRAAIFAQFMGFVAGFEHDFPNWWFDPAEGGGWLGASGSHVVDFIRQLLGEFDSVSAALGNVGLTRGDVDDSFALRFRLKNGLEGTMQQSSGSFGPMVDLNRIAGSEGSLWLDHEGVHFADRTSERILTIPADLQLPEPPPLGGDPRQQRMDWQAMASVEIAPYTELCKSVRAAILREPAPSPVPLASFADGIANMQVLDAIRESARRGGAVVKVDEL